MDAVVGTDGEPLEDEISSHFYMTPKLSAYMRLMWGRDTTLGYFGEKLEYALESIPVNVPH